MVTLYNNRLPYVCVMSGNEQGVIQRSHTQQALATGNVHYHKFPKVRLHGDRRESLGEERDSSQSASMHPRRRLAGEKG